MPHTLTVYDESTGGARDEALELTFPTDEITVRELIRERVHQEVKDYNASKAQSPVFRGLVQPTGAEEALNGYKLKKPRMIDWEPQFEKAIDAFESRQILILVNGTQVDDLEERIEVAPGTEVSFVRLVPLVGG